MTHNERISNRKGSSWATVLARIKTTFIGWALKEKEFWGISQSDMEKMEMVPEWSFDKALSQALC